MDKIIRTYSDTLPRHKFTGECPKCGSSQIADVSVNLDSRTEVYDPTVMCVCGYEWIEVC